MCTYADAIERKSIEKAEYRCFKNCMDRGMPLEDAKALSGASDEDAMIKNTGLPYVFAISRSADISIPKTV